MQPNHARVLMRRTLQQWKRFRADNVSVLTVRRHGCLMSYGFDKSWKVMFPGAV